MATKQKQASDPAPVWKIRADEADSIQELVTAMAVMNPERRAQAEQRVREFELWQERQR